MVARVVGRMGYALVAFPVGVVSLTGSQLQSRLLLGTPTAAGRARRAACAAVSLPLGLVSTLVAAYGLFLLPMNLLYPLRPLVGMGSGSYEDAWGGPTLAGAWAVHAAGGLAVSAVLMLVALGATRLQERLARRFSRTGTMAR